MNNILPAIRTIQCKSFSSANAVFSHKIFKSILSNLCFLVSNICCAPFVYLKSCAFNHLDTVLLDDGKLLYFKIFAEMILLSFLFSWWIYLFKIVDCLLSTLNFGPRFFLCHFLLWFIKFWIADLVNSKREAISE